MTAATATLARPLAADARPGIGRLTAVELRKMTDTRAGFWLLAATSLLTVALVVVFCIFAEERDRTLLEMLSVAVAPASVLLPIVGILLASVALSLVALAIAVVVALVGIAFAAGDGEDARSLSAGMLGQTAISLSTGMLMGAAFGAALLSSAPAIVLYFGLPFAWSVLGFIPALEGPARWLDGARTLTPLTEHLLSATEWARAGTTLALWILVPLLIGLWRIARDEVR